MKNLSTVANLDWITILLYVMLVTMGWLNIYSASSPVDGMSSFDFAHNYGRQLIFIFFSIFLIILILFIDPKIYERFAGVIYIIAMLSLLGLFFFGKTVNGQTNWYAIGSFSIQPSEFAKTATALAVAKFLGDVQVNLKYFNRQLQALALIFIPVLLIVPHDPGSALIFIFLVFTLNREGLPSIYIFLGFTAILLFILALLINIWFLIALIFLVLVIDYFRSKRINRNIILSSIIFISSCLFVASVSYIFDNVFQPHHRDRINVMFGKEVDMQGVGYNLNQSKIAIGSGGWFGKGFMEGTQTKGSFVPEQHTDFIFTTVGEEWGFVGSLVVIFTYVGLIFRIIHLAENQRTKFSRVYGYCVACILFIHFFANVAMVLGIFPTIGVPLPFFSYGGSGLWAFTILLFIFVKLDANKVNEW